MSSCKNFWHLRLGHPSSNALNFILNLKNIVKRKTNVESTSCDVCFRAKQCCAPFPLSNSKANEVFELIHCDL